MGYLFAKMDLEAKTGYNPFLASINFVSQHLYMYTSVYEIGDVPVFAQNNALLLFIMGVERAVSRISQ